MCATEKRRGENSCEGSKEEVKSYREEFDGGRARGGVLLKAALEELVEGGRVLLRLAEGRRIALC